MTLFSRHPNRAEILLVGNELLIGKTRDTNGLFLIRRLLDVGCVVGRVTTIPDELDVIRDAIAAAWARAPKFLFTSGGLGPTFDDMTLAGVARGLSRALDRPVPLECHPGALATLKARYAKREKALNAAREKMAHLPRGARPLRNPVGSAPGVLFEAGATTLYCLPGVPRELEAIVDLDVMADVRAKVDPVHFYQGSFIERGVGESDMAREIADIYAAHPSVYIKTHPRFREGPHVEVHVQSFESQARVDEVLAELATLVRDLGGQIDERPPR